MTIYIVDLEAVDTRYTKEWKEHLPKQLQRASNQAVVTISGGDTPQATTPGAFLNFGGTNVYKSAQMEKIGKMFCDGKIKLQIINEHKIKNCIKIIQLRL